jgi:hypothetical protein
MTDYTNNTRDELVALCKEKGIKGYSGKRKSSMIQLLKANTNVGGHVVTVTAAHIREGGLDKFYTVPAIAEKCLSRIGGHFPWSMWDLIVEPSAGNGSFLHAIPSANKMGLDICPEHPDILQQDFFTYTPPTNRGKVLVVGNPPFGRVSSLAIRFFNHAAKWADVIAFIIPRTFRRVSVQNKLHSNFHLLFDENIPMEPCSFTPPILAKCCFQIWEKRNSPRNMVELSTTHCDWEFLPFGPKDVHGQPTPPSGADFAIRAYGGTCGDIVTSGLERLRPKSWHWIKAKLDKKTLMDRFVALDYIVSRDTARQNSIGRGELVRLYEESYHAMHNV